MKILILCTGNSCRSQMAHGFLQSFDKNIQVYSAGTHPAEKVNPLVVKIMSEVGIDTLQIQGGDLGKVSLKAKDNINIGYEVTDKTTIDVGDGSGGILSAITARATAQKPAAWALSQRP